MAFGSVTVGVNSNASKGWIFRDNGRLTTDFRVPYDADHTSPAEDSNGTPVHFIQMQALVAGDRMRFGIWNNEGKNGSVKEGATTKDILGTGGTDAYGETRVLRQGPISFLGDSGQSFRMGIIKMPSADAAHDWIGVTNSTGSTGQMTYYSQSWKKLDQYSDPFFGVVWYNTVPTKVRSISVSAGVNTSSEITLQWTAPLDDGGDTINGYRIEWSKDSGFSGLAGSVQDTKNLKRIMLVKGLESGTTYYFRVAALNGVTDLLGDAHSGPWGDAASGATTAGTDIEAVRNEVADKNYRGLRNYQSAYAVQDANGKVILNSAWLASGAGVTAKVTGPGEITMTLIGPNKAIPGYTAPYTFAVQNEDGYDRSAITLRGWGVVSRPTTIRMATGASTNVTKVESAREVNNVILGTKKKVWSRATLATEEHSGSISEITFSISGERANTFLPGTSFKYDDSLWRVSSMAVTNGSASITARMFTHADDVDMLWRGKTVDQRDDALAGIDADDLSIKPLYTGS